MFIVFNKDKLISCFISFSVVAILLTIGIVCKKGEYKSIAQPEAEKRRSYQTELVYTKNYVNSNNIVQT